MIVLLDAATKARSQFHGQKLADRFDIRYNTKGLVMMMMMELFKVFRTS